MTAPFFPGKNGWQKVDIFWQDADKKREKYPPVEMWKKGRKDQQEKFSFLPMSATVKEENSPNSPTLITKD
ncbi:MAG: hypothetical protein IIZ45_00510 [Firmicutes bacterium]|nr:hypothetical protein [Bacillota bacterium]